MRVVAIRSRSASFKEHKNPSLLPGFEFRTVHPAASRCTHYSSPVPQLECVINQSFPCLRYLLHVQNTAGSPETSLLCTISTRCDKQKKSLTDVDIARAKSRSARGLVLRIFEHIACYSSRWLGAKRGTPRTVAARDV
jgi:hypothetical protein